MSAKPSPRSKPYRSKPYRSTPVFDETTLPQALRSRHSTKAGVWGMVRVLEGRLRLTYFDPLRDIVLDPRTPGPLAPEQAHFVEPLGPMRMQVDFYDRPPDG
ncbi:DUF1971 domain-containing protein [Chelatococcus reniformis]|uniref:TehB/YeaR-like domain-containing protein n=1 Tax=Chelatococcus reniformis TaxID=1494448 RepID=A0A916TWA8_9HYPH|nr:DUF1971 domain-containing protein [Chelatococcus reniformis]GGC45268.1 hypothetical protein GCM10010994_00520 [Chelatococcus reniformis]